MSQLILETVKIQHVLEVKIVFGALKTELPYLIDR